MRSMQLFFAFIKEIPLTSYIGIYFLCQALDMVKKTPAYKNKLKAMELERTGGATSRKKSNKQTNKYENFLFLNLFLL